MDVGPKTLLAAVQYFSDEDNCIKHLAAKRWPDGVVVCPTCGRKGAGYLAKQRRWQCSARHPKRQFSIKVGTIFEESPIGLDKWLPVLWLVANCKNGVSSWEIHRDLGVTQKTAWFMLHRIRLAMQNANNGGKLGGPMGEPVEIDETYIGGKSRNMHSKRRAEAFRGWGNKTVVMGVLERHGHVRAEVLSNTSNAEIRPAVQKHVEFGSTIHSDLQGRQWEMPQHYIHEMVNHQAEEYVRGNVHTNGIENFWNLLKRSVGGTYVSVEPFHLFRYVDEQAFRYNHRKDANGELLNDGDRFNALCDQIVGKRLTYKELIGKEAPSSEPF